MTLLRSPIVLAVALASTAALADTPPVIEAARDAANAVADPVTAVTRATQASLALQKLGDLAKRSKDSDVQQLGRLVKNDADHANAALHTVAKQMQLRPVTNIAPDTSSHLDDLGKEAPDKSFDRALLDEMLAQEREGAGLLEHVSDQVRGDEKPHVNRAALALREAERATMIKLKPLE